MAVLDRLTDTAQHLIEGARVHEAAELVGIGVASRGIIHDRTIQLAPNNQGWEDVALCAILRQRLGIDAVAADNDVKVATIAEATWGALAGVTDGVLVNLGTGFAAGAIVNGALLRGAHGAGLEIAYQVPLAGTVRGMRAGSAPLEEQFSGGGIAATASALLGRQVDTQEVLAAAADRSPGAGAEARLAEFAREAVQVGARAIANLAIALDPQLVVLCGGMLHSPDPLVSSIQVALEEFVPFPPQLVLAHFIFNAPLAGAALLAYRTARLPLPESLALDAAGKQDE